MKLHRIIIISAWMCLLLLTESIYADEYSKLDPRLRMIMHHPEMVKLHKSQTYGISKLNANPQINVILRTSANSTYLEGLGLNVYAIIGNIATANASIDHLEILNNDPLIEYIEAPRPLNLHTDIAVPEIGATAISQNYSATGHGVIIGIIDTGIDWRHQDFRHADGTTRIKYLLDFSYPGDVNNDNILDGPDQYGGTLYTEQEINNALFGIGFVYSDDVVGHGTHVAGIAAGNGRATGNGFPSGRYTGVAPEADLIIVKATRVQGSQSFSTDDYVNALKFIDDMATNLGKPYVVNMSLGGNDGAHDGTTLSEQAIDQLVGSDIPGKVVVVSAGNDGENDIHSSGIFSNLNNSYEIKFQVDEYDSNASSYDDYILFEAWYDATANMSVTIEDPDGGKYGPISRGNEYSKSTANGAIYIDNSSGGKNPFNQDYQVIIQLFDYEILKPPAEGQWKIILSGTNGRYDLWISASTMSASLTSQVDQTMLIANPGAAFNVITVGSYVTKNRWQDLDGKTISPYPLPQLYTASAFSSPGPTRDFRMKPEISAPGEWIASSFSTDAPPSGLYTMYNTENPSIPNGFITPDGVHALAQGTSFSAPFVTGVVALLFERFPDLDAIEIRSAITDNAKNDAFTTSLNKWGYGKLDGLKTMQFLSGDVTAENLSINIFQNPALTQYIDIYLITNSSPETTPTATLREANGFISTITLAQLEPLIYKGEHKFTTQGTATLEVTTKFPGEPAKITTKYFGVNILKAGSGGLLKYEDIELNVLNNDWESDVYVTFVPSKITGHNTDLSPLGSAYKIGPESLQFPENVSMSFHINASLCTEQDVQKLAIYRLDQEIWVKLDSRYDANQSAIVTQIDRLGTYALFYDMNCDQNAIDIPDKYFLFKNYPNPFNSNTTIKYQLPDDSDISLTIYNINGQKIRTLFQGMQTAGVHTILWDGMDQHSSPVSSGIYLYKIESHAFTAADKMLYLK
ncbi:S8 family serine peptidase [candidate division KSB1 bacterium]|nr:S8 family serine peptidase [candidate division KSB1 bacterium]